MQPLLDSIGHLDFEPVIPCEHSEHQKCHGNEAASFYVRAWCVVDGCNDLTEYFICRPGWNLLAEDDVECNDCGGLAPRNECMKIIDIVKGY